MFHFAEPDDAGSAVTILMPGLIRSSQPVMCFGLPLRTHDHDDRVGDDALGRRRCSSSRRRTSGTSLVMSGPTENPT